jgi:hypothetical protein
VNVSELLFHGVQLLGALRSAWLTVCQVLGYTKLHEIDPHAANARMKNYERYIKSQFEKPHDILLTIHSLVREIDFVEAKENNGDLRWRYDAALLLARHISQAVHTYMEELYPWNSQMLAALKSADV